MRSPAGGGNFTTLSPRQPLMVTPYALYALSGPGSGGPWAVSGNDVFNTNTGNVGSGTSAPQTTLHVAEVNDPIIAIQRTSSNTRWWMKQNNNGTELAIGNTSSMVDTNIKLAIRDNGNVGIGTAIPGGKIDIQASDNSNVLFGRRTGGGLAHNLFIDGSGNGSMQLLDATATPRINLGAQNSTYFNYGNVGIGTTTPGAKLDVRGDIRLGPTGQLRATSGEENLRIIRGTIAPDASILAGTGSTVTHPATGEYPITFTPAFAAAPTVTATPRLGPFDRTATIMVEGPVTASDVKLFIDTNDDDHEGFNLTDREFHFIAIGPR